MENEPEPAYKHIRGSYHYIPPTQEVQGDYSNDGINHVSLAGSIYRHRNHSLSPRPSAKFFFLSPRQTSGFILNESENTISRLDILGFVWNIRYLALRDELSDLRGIVATEDITPPSLHVVRDNTPKADGIAYLKED